MKNKKGQFLIIGAVILGIIILGLGSVWNKAAKTRSMQKKADILCENYKLEVFKISEYAIRTQNKNQEPDLIFNFTNNFLNNTKKSGYNLGFIYVYGNSTKVDILNETNSSIIVSVSANNLNRKWIKREGLSIENVTGKNITWINITSDKIDKHYRINDNNLTNFWFLILLRNGEEYVCE